MWAASGRRIPEYFPPCVPEHGVALFGFILRLVDGDRQRAEDVVHETLLRAWKHPAALHPLSGKPAALAVHGRPPSRHRRAASTPHEPRRAQLHPPTA